MPAAGRQGHARSRAPCRASAPSTIPATPTTPQRTHVHEPSEYRSVALCGTDVAPAHFERRISEGGNQYPPGLPPLHRIKGQPFFGGRPDDVSEPRPQPQSLPASQAEGPAQTEWE